MNQYGEEYDIVLINGYEYSMEPLMLCMDAIIMYGNPSGSNRFLHRDERFVILCHPNWIRKEYWPWKDIDNILVLPVWNIQSFDLQVRVPDWL